MKARIHIAYRGELYGIAFFNYFAGHRAVDDHSSLWKALVEIETLTAKLLQQSLDKHAIEYDKYDPLMQLKGEKDAAAWIDLPWSKLVQTLRDWVEPYESKYRAWADEATEESNAFKLIADHETAIYECLQAEISGQSGLPFLLRFLKHYSDG